MKLRSLIKVSNLMKVLSLLVFLSLSYTILGQVDDPLRDGIPKDTYNNLPPRLMSPMAPVTVNYYDNFNLGTDFAECHISTHPRDPLQFFVAYNINGTHHTEDGFNWSINNPNFGTSPAGDPVTAYDSLGNLYYENMYGYISGTKVVKSTNNGQTWQTWVYGNSGNDKNWICADQTGGPYSNYLYTTMSNGSGVNIKRSTNLGASFVQAQSISINRLPGTMACVGPNGSIQGGTVHLVINSGSAFASGYVFYKSTNGGASFTAVSAQYFSGYLGNAVNGRNSIHNMRLRPYPFITADNSYGSHRGRLYLVYATNNPAGNGNKSDVYCRYSDNQGATWSSGVIVNDDPNSQNNYQFQPAVWCDKATGRLYIQWMDTRDTPTTDSALIYASYSNNGGASFVTNQQISNQKMRIDCPSCPGGGYPRYQGDYTGITSNSKTSMVAWTDFRYGSFASFVAYYPDFAMRVYPALDSLNSNNGSVDYRFEIPSVKSFTDIASFSATISPTPGSGSLTVSFPNGNTIPTFPYSKPMRVTATGGVTTGTYTITVVGQGSNGTPIHKRTVSVYVSPTVSGVGNNEVINKYELSQNYPNPFNPVTRIDYNILYKSDVKITIYNALGKAVTTFDKPQQDPGKHFVIFNARNLASGVYYYKL
ncbi:MAG: T9SS type A sorting domain-containing protein, partial [Ignavibacteria bacterium]|nr:T9SS type A sorting domain-containing protein [Ignavibacteria bacterium]